MSAPESATWHHLDADVRAQLATDATRCPLCHMHANRQEHTPTCPNRSRCRAVHCACSAYAPEAQRSPEWDKCALCGHTEQLHRPEDVTR